MCYFGFDIFVEIGYIIKWDLICFEGCGISVFGLVLFQIVSLWEFDDDVVMGFMQFVMQVWVLQGEVFLNNLGNLELLNVVILVGIWLFFGLIIVVDEDEF